MCPYCGYHTDYEQNFCPWDGKRLRSLANIINVVDDLEKRIKIVEDVKVDT